MVKINRPKRREAPENTIALINIIFLMLIFFLVAGSLTPPLDGTVSMIGTETAEGTDPPDALTIGADGALRYRGQPTTLEAAVARHRETGAASFKIVADRALPAATLVETTGDLRVHDIGSVLVITERMTP
jgi:biopolymer transport protein ExbD